MFRPLKPRAHRNNLRYERTGWWALVGEKMEHWELWFWDFRRLYFRVPRKTNQADQQCPCMLPWDQASRGIIVMYVWFVVYMLHDTYLVFDVLQWKDPRIIPPHCRRSANTRLKISKSLPAGDVEQIMSLNDVCRKENSLTNSTLNQNQLDH